MSDTTSDTGAGFPPPPPVGTMALYDSFEPPLTSGTTYQLDGYVTITEGDPATSSAAPPNFPAPSGSEGNTATATRYVSVVGPQFSLTPADVAGVFPPRNSVADVAENLPHIALFRRTLPWERELDPDHPDPTMPWLALLLAADDDSAPITFAPTVHIATDPVLSVVYADAATDAVCNTVSSDAANLAALLPLPAELPYLSHVRQVNSSDAVLDAGSSDGWFSVVVGNRIPVPGKHYTAYLVSLENRSDFLTNAGDGGTSAGANTTLAVLCSWSFSCGSGGTFDRLAQCLDVGIICCVATAGQPQVADTGHVPMVLQDRAGAQETVWYRGPATPLSLTRDANGPYYTADQCRRLSPDTGAEDISYAASFELGRLLAASDPRLAQELMTWRRSNYAAVQRALINSTLSDRVRSFASPPSVVPGAIFAGLVAGWEPLARNLPLVVADPGGLATIAGAPGRDPAALRAAWPSASTEELSAACGAGDGGQLLGAGPVTVNHGADTSPDVAIVATDAKALADLRSARAGFIAGTGEAP